MLIGNYSVLNKSPGRAFGGSTVSDSKGNWGKSGAARGRFYPADVATNPNYKYGTPNGYRPPYSWVIAQKDGGMASNTIINGEGLLTISSLAGGKAAVATLSGSGTISSAALALIVSAVAMLSGSGAISSAPLVGIANMAATLAGDGDLTGSLKAIGKLIATVNGNGGFTATLKGTGNMVASITPFTTLSPENLASSVWNSLVEDYETSGTMGQVQGKTLTTSKFLALK
jgi:hypothetical protein